jgi:hypothetical protein
MTNLIIRLNFTQLRNETHVECNENVDRLIDQYDPSTLGILPQYQIYQPLFAEEVAALDVIRKSEYTGEIHEQDLRRDSIFRGFDEAVQSAQHHFVPEKQEAAKRITVVIEHYGNIAAKNYDQETAAIDDLIRELATGDYPSLISLLGLNDWLTQLDAENQRFKNLMAERYTEVSQRPITRMKAARAETDKALRVIFNRIEALALVNGVATYEAFIRELNAVLERYKNIQAQEKGRRKAHTNSNKGA